MNDIYTIIRNTGSSYVGRNSDGNEVKCLVKGNFRIKGIRTTNPVAVGDHVRLSEPGPDGTAYIEEVVDRRNYIIRRASNLSKAAHIIAANVDCAMLVATLVHPPTSFTFIDRFLATAEAYGVEAVLVFNKTDLLQADPDDQAFLEAAIHLYNTVGYRAIAVSAKTGEGLDELRNVLKGKITLLSGNSGVGKTTLINSLIPGLDLKTAEISAVHDTGMHTTTFSEMYTLPDGGDIIDTPGVRGFGVYDFEREQVSHYFRDIFKVSENCRFDNCTHTHEPGCAVRDAVDEHLIAETRYNSYLSILEETTSPNDKYRKGY